MSFETVAVGPTSLKDEYGVPIEHHLGACRKALERVSTSLRQGIPGDDKVNYYREYIERTLNEFNSDSFKPTNDEESELKLDLKICEDTLKKVLEFFESKNKYLAAVDHTLSLVRDPYGQKTS